MRDQRVGSSETFRTSVGIAACVLQCAEFSETPMARDYVQKHEKGYRIAGTRVSLDSIVYAYLEGLRPESIADDFPALSLEEVYGAIAYYLGHREEVDAYLKRLDEQFPALQQRIRENYPLLNQKLDEAGEREPLTHA